MDNTTEDTKTKARNRIAAEGAAIAAEGLLEDSGPDVEQAFYTDSTSVPGFVLLGIAIRHKASGVILIPTREYDGLKLLAIIQRPPVSAASSPALALPVR